MSENSLRSFIAFEIPKEINNLCSTLQKQLSQSGVKGKWVKQNNHHITIYFLGNKISKELELINSNINDLNINLAEIQLSLTGLSSFGRPPKVLFLEMKDHRNAAANTVSKIISVNSLKEENRKWVPHVTLARFRNAKESNSLLKQGKIDVSVCKFSPSRITVFISKLTQEGPIYIPYNRFR